MEKSEVYENSLKSINSILKIWKSKANKDLKKNFKYDLSHQRKPYWNSLKLRIKFLLKDLKKNLKHKSLYER